MPALHWKTAKCAACDAEVPRPQLERLMWVVVCHECARRLAADPSWRAPRPVHRFDAAIVAFLLYAALAGVGRLLGADARALIAGAATADLISWLAFSAITAAFAGIDSWVSLVLRACGLALIVTTGLPLFSASSAIFEGSIGFAVVVIAKSGWFVARFGGGVEVDEVGDEEFDPLGDGVVRDADHPPPSSPLRESRRAG